MLHGGGSAGNAWEIGVIAGLHDAGLAAARADLIVGTSAGATAAAQITAADPTDLLADILSDDPPLRGRQQGVPPAGANGGRSGARPPVNHLERTNRIIAAATDAADMRRRMGAGALELDAASDGSWSARWREIVARRLPSEQWPEQTVLITAVDARTGEGVAFDRHSGVELVDAVAASTSSGDPYRIGDDLYIDGGYRRNENADLATGYERVLVLSPFGGRTRHPLEWRMQLAAQVEELVAAGSRVETILPDAASLDAFGEDMMDGSRRPASARAGYEQGKAAARRLAEFWS
ncbi:patatin-like phospholipase family protein [Humibacter antri]